MFSVLVSRWMELGRCRGRQAGGNGVDFNYVKVIIF